MPKRKWEPPPGAPVVRPRKRAHLVQSGRCPPEMTTRQRANCGFLQKLPAEIRNRIYEYVLGHNVVHIATKDCPWDAKAAWPYTQYYRYKGWSRYKYLKFTHTICHRPGREEATYNDIKTIKDFMGRLPSYSERHQRCFHILHQFQESWWRDDKLHMHKRTSSTHLDKYKYSKLDLCLLRVCRQIHSEAALIPYVSNTFAFESGLDLDLFVSQSLIAPQRKAIQSLQIHSWLEGYQGFPGVLPETVMQLKGLKHLTLSVYQYRSKSMKGPYLFSQLALKKVEVIVELGSRHSNSERRKYAEKIEHSLLAGSRSVASSSIEGITNSESTMRDLVSRLSACSFCGNILVTRWTCHKTYRSYEDEFSCSACGTTMADTGAASRKPPSASGIAQLLKTTTQKVYKMLPRGGRHQIEPFTADRLCAVLDEVKPRKRGAKTTKIQLASTGSPKRKRGRPPLSCRTANSKHENNSDDTQDSPSDPYANDDERKVVLRPGTGVVWK